MPWLQISFVAPPEQVTPLVDALEAAGALSVTVKGDDAELRLQAGLEETALWRHNDVTALYPEYTDVDAIVRHLRAQPGNEPPPPRIDLLPDADWASAWMAHYRPQRVGRDLWVCPSWLAPPEPAAVNILLDPGLAFGTGDHPTTALCLEWLAEQPPRERDVIDYGCGSGILAIAALKLGARRAHAVDIDPQALRVTQENAERNGVLSRLTISLPEELADAPADLVIANILALPLIELAPRLSSLVRPAGQLLLTGLLGEQAADVRAAYDDRFDFEERQRGQWVLLIGRRKGHS
jgi:ribosomal protein L11 methyltransferase